MAYEFVATGWSTRVFLRADLTCLFDTGVAFDNVSLELLTPRDPEPWMLTGAPPVESRNLQGIHDSGAEDQFVQAGRRGWVTEALAIESAPADESGRRFTEWIPDGIALHTYTDSQGWNEASFSDYQRKIANLPDSMKRLPLYITEAGTGGPGNPTIDAGLIDRMFDHVHRWNLAGGQQVRAVCFYRWTAGADKWSIEGNAGMRADFAKSLAKDYRWFQDPP